MTRSAGTRSSTPIAAAGSGSTGLTRWKRSPIGWKKARHLNVSSPRLIPATGKFPPPGAQRAVGRCVHGPNTRNTRAATWKPQHPLHAWLPEELAVVAVEGQAGIDARFNLP